jgi:XTP/dITP diphosphohydrolase
MTTLLIATRNAHKVAEIRAILLDRFDYLRLDDCPDTPKVDEDAETFAGNAAKKATELMRWLVAAKPPTLASRLSNLLVLADDSGLEVDAIHGAPGVHSARFAALDRDGAGNSSDAENNAKLMRLLEKVPMERRTARFRCVLALAAVDPKAHVSQPLLFEGACEGRIGFGPRGQGGFGYDPLFVPVGFEQSFAELGESVKNRLSHRAKALARLREFLASLKDPAA